MTDRPNPEKRYGRYRILAPLGTGGMARVYRAYDPVLDRQVAIKVVGELLQSNEAARASFQREARAVAGLRHPHVVHVFDFGEEHDELYMVMELIDGPTLADRIAGLRQAGQLMPHPEVATILGQVAAALDDAHAQGVIHRDVKPGNILLRNGRSDDVVLADFGLAQFAQQASSDAHDQSFGTPQYIAPEQALHGAGATALSDVYSLGVVAYLLLTDQLPFEADSPAELAQLHVNALPPSLRARVPDLAPELDAIVLRALEKDPARRFPTCGQFAAALRAVLAPAAPVPRARREAAEPTTALAAPPLVPVWPAVRVESRSGGAAGVLPATAAVPPISAAPVAVPASRRRSWGYWLLAAALLVVGLCGLASAAVIPPLSARLASLFAAPAGTATATTTPIAATPSAQPEASPQATPAPGTQAALELISTLRASLAQAQRDKRVRANVIQHLAKDLDPAATALQAGNIAGARAGVNAFSAELAKRERDIPPDLYAAWQLAVQQILAALPEG